MTVGRLLKELDDHGGVDELIEWMAYARVEPFGFDVDNYRMGAVASTVANVAPRPRGAKAMKPSDFYPATRKSQGLTSRQERQLAERQNRKKGK
jgi:hypothetical protein